VAKFRVVLLDRPAWFVPAIEQEELARIDAEVLVGWARLGQSKALDPVDASLVLPIEELSRISISYVPRARHTAEVIGRMASDADAILVTSAPVTAEILDRLPRLRVVGRPGIGYDVVDVEAATARGVAVFSAPGFCAREVAGRARAFGFRLLAHDPFVEPSAALACGVSLVGLDELLARSDIVSVHAPLMKATFHLLGEREFALMKPTACVINTARGPVIDQAALIAALTAGGIGGAGLDVFEQEPLEADSPLLGMENVLLTPHTAGLSDTRQIAVRRRTAENIARALVGDWPESRDLINPQVKGHPRQARKP
jgi:D-3-phosphoglycerate dehydrogenase